MTRDSEESDIVSWTGDKVNLNSIVVMFSLVVSVSLPAKKYPIFEA